jgi:hypothetical protein
VRAALATLLLASCAATTGTVAPVALPDRPAALGIAIQCTKTQPCAYSDGVWMPDELATWLAQSEDRWSQCKAELEKEPRPCVQTQVPSWGAATAICATCAAAGVGGTILLKK